jgi:hypothetical protein
MPSQQPRDTAYTLILKHIKFQVSLTEFQSVTFVKFVIGNLFPTYHFSKHKYYIDNMIINNTNKTIKTKKNVRLHKIEFPTDSKELVWKIYYLLKEKPQFKNYGVGKMKNLFRYISDNWVSLERQQIELQKIQGVDLNIAKPKSYSEFEVQATLYAILKFNHKIDVRGEVSYKMPTYGELKASSSRFDLVIFKNDKAICIIEVKNGKKEKQNTTTRQFKKYSQFGIKLVYCMNMNFVKQVAQEVLDFHNNYEASSGDLVSRLFDKV